MPIYEYQCKACGHHLEELQKVSDPVLVTCPACGKAALEKLVSHTSFQLKGTGWYATDFKGKGAKAPKDPETVKESDKTPDKTNRPQPKRLRNLLLQPEILQQLKRLLKR